MFTTESIELIGNFPKFTKAVETAESFAVSKVPVLISGEPGTGKKSIARRIHDLSARAEKPFLVVDCSQDPIQVEKEVLGFRDAETGAFNKGVLESANGGTVVLSNIEGIAEAFQKRLVQILGEIADYDIDVRMIATTTKNLSKFVGSGRFYRALFTYFSNNQIQLAPLRDRGTDIQLIAENFVTGWCQEQGQENIAISSDAFDKLQNCYWSHNVKELCSVLSSSLKNVGEEKVLDVNAIELGERKAEVVNIDGDDDGFKLMSLKDAEKLLIKKALIHTSENRTQAAKILGVSIRTLRNKINEYRSAGNNYFVNLR